MPTTPKWRSLAKLASVLALLLVSLGAHFIMSAQPVLAGAGDNYPWKDAATLSSGDWGYSTCPSSDSNCMIAKETSNGVTYGVADPWGYYLRYCTSWAAWAVHDRNGVNVPHGLGNADTWATRAIADGYTVNTTPGVGAVAQWNDHDWNSNFGHVAWVSSVNSDGTSIGIEEYNADYTGNYATATFVKGSSKPLPWPDNFIHFADLSSSPSPTPSSNNTVLAVKKLTQSDGTNEVFWAKNTDVFESWWRGGSGIHLGNIIHISQGDIVDIDAQMLGNEHLIYTATNHWIYETWWYPGGALHTAAIVNSSSNVRHIQKTIGSDGVTHQLYVLTDTGASEYWWNSGSNGVQGGSLYNLRNPVAMQKFMEPGGTQVLFVADQNYAYMVRWGGGLSGIQVSTIIDVSGITSLSFSEDSDGKHRLYVGASSGSIWEASWYTGGSISYWYMTGGGSAVALQKWESDSTQVLYEATAGGVFEYWWPTNSNLLHAFTIVGGLSSVHAFVRSTDPNGVQSVYTATGTNVLESWWIPGGDGIHTGTIA